MNKFNKIFLANFIIVCVLCAIPLLPLSLISNLREEIAIPIAFSVFIISKVDLALLILSIIYSIFILAQNLVPQKTKKNFLLIFLSGLSILFYITIFALFIQF